MLDVVACCIDLYWTKFFHDSGFLLKPALLFPLQSPMIRSCTQIGQLLIPAIHLIFSGTNNLALFPIRTCFTTTLLTLLGGSTLTPSCANFFHSASPTIFVLCHTGWTLVVHIASPPGYLAKHSARIPSERYKAPTLLMLYSREPVAATKDANEAIVTMLNIEISSQ
jgi:hypothetical protein